MSEIRDSEIRDAATRLRRLKNSADPLFVYECVDEQYPNAIWLHRRDRDRETLADAWLARVDRDGEIKAACRRIIEYAGAATVEAREAAGILKLLEGT